MVVIHMIYSISSGSQIFCNTTDKTYNSAQKPETHDGIALAASHFMSFEQFHTVLTRGHHWLGQVTVTPAPFRVISRPNFYRRKLHFDNPEKAGTSKRKGGTITPFDFRSGDKVRAEKAGVIYIGWLGGYTQTEKAKKLSVYDHNWRRIRQFSPNKIQLLQRSTILCVTA